MKKKKRRLRIFHVILPLFCMSFIVQTGCLAPAAKPENVQESAKDSQFAALPSQGEVMAGFTAQELGTIPELGADTVLFTHEKSGAQLLYIQNNDTELGFNIAYKTPCLDETDTNHIFEHAISASSDKYPGTNLFFDMYNKTYSTFLNAYTYSVYTEYPICSQSEEQLLKMMDVYLSCMVAPGIMTDENIFKREALRFELEDMDSPITMQGTVFSEDYGRLTDTSQNAFSALQKALYPGTTAANRVGKLHLNYQDLTYEKVKETYDRCYHFDNSIMILYGNMDYRNFLEFIDSEYLSKAVKNNTDLTAYMEETVPPGYVEKRVESPAYEGDTVEESSVIEYAIDLSEDSWEDIFGWKIFAEMLNDENSPLQKETKEAGISNIISSEVIIDSAKPILLFELLDTDEEKQEAFLRAIDRTLAGIAADGIEQSIYQTVLKQYQITEYTARNTTAVSVEAGNNIINYWMHTGKTDYYTDWSASLERAEKDTEQKWLKELAGKAENPARSACVTAVPTKGLAEEKDAEDTKYLADKKASMTDAELEQMIAETKEFQTWNEKQVHNTDFMIEVKDLPDPVFQTNYKKTRFGSITSYTAPVEVEKAGQSRIYFDLRGVPAEDIYYVPIYQILMGKLDSGSHSVQELHSLMAQYLYGFDMNVCYPEEKAGVNARPMLFVDWTSMTEDYETGLRLLLEILEQTDFTDTEKIQEVMEKYLPGYDQSRYADKLTLALNEARAYTNRNRAFNQSVYSQDQYRFMKEVLRRLREEEGYGEEFAEKMEEISTSLLNRNGIITVNIAAQQSLEDMEKTVQNVLGGLPSFEQEVPDYGTFRARKKVRAICVEASDQYIVREGSMDELSGKDLSFLMAASDLYLTQVLRFQMGAYSADIDFSLPLNSIDLWTSSDPNVGATLDVWDEMGDYLRKADISQEEMNGYILGAYGYATQPYGIFDSQILAVNMEIMGADIEAIREKTMEIRETTLQDKNQAADRLEKSLQQGGTVVVGNQIAIEKEKDRFDEILNDKE